AHGSPLEVLGEERQFCRESSGVFGAVTRPNPYNASRYSITCRVSWVGVEAPEVTPPRPFPCSHSGLMSFAVSTRYAGLCASSLTTCTSRLEFELRSLPTTMTTSHSLAPSTAASWGAWVARQISL